MAAQNVMNQPRFDFVTLPVGLQWLSSAVGQAFGVSCAGLSWLGPLNIGSDAGIADVDRSEGFFNTPSHLLESHIWPLLDDTTRAALKGSCKAGSDLCNQLVRHVRLHAPSRRTSHRSRTPEAAHAASFVRRLPLLEALTIDDATLPLEAWLSALAAQGAPLDRVRTLTVIAAHTHALSAAATVGHLARSLPSLQRATFQLHAIPACLGAALAASCPALEHLELSQHVGDVTGLQQALRSLECLPGLHTLAVHQLAPWPLASGAGCLEAVANVRSLQRLVWGAAWSWAALAHLAQLPKLSALELACQPDAAAGGAGAPGAAEVHASLGSMASLEHLHMPRTELNWGMWHGVLAALPHLHGAAFRRARLLAPPAPLPQLESLALECESSVDALALAVGSLPAVRRVSSKAGCWLSSGRFPEQWRTLLELEQNLQRHCEAGDVDVSLALSLDAGLGAQLDDGEAQLHGEAMQEMSRASLSSGSFSRLGGAGVHVALARGALPGVSAAVERLVGDAFPSCAGRATMEVTCC